MSFKTKFGRLFLSGKTDKESWMDLKSRIQSENPAMSLKDVLKKASKIYRGK